MKDRLPGRSTAWVCHHRILGSRPEPCGSTGPSGARDSASGARGHEQKVVRLYRQDEFIAAVAKSGPVADPIRDRCRPRRPGPQGHHGARGPCPWRGRCRMRCPGSSSSSPQAREMVQPAAALREHRDLGSQFPCSGSRPGRSCFQAEHLDRSQQDGEAPGPCPPDRRGPVSSAKAPISSSVRRPRARTCSTSRTSTFADNGRCYHPPPSPGAGTACSSQPIATRYPRKNTRDGYL